MEHVRASPPLSYYTVPPTLPPPPPSSPAARAVMLGNRSRDTAPELALRHLLHRRGLRYRLDDVPEPTVRCRADIVFRRARVAVFVDGCFWHRCPIHATAPKANAEYWAAKFDRNVARDRRNDAALAAAGWTVVRVWEHEDPRQAADRVASILARTGASARDHRSSPGLFAGRRSAPRT